MNFLEKLITQLNRVHNLEIAADASELSVLEAIEALPAGTNTSSEVLELVKGLATKTEAFADTFVTKESFDETITAIAKADDLDAAKQETAKLKVAVETATKASAQVATDLDTFKKEIVKDFNEFKGTTSNTAQHAEGAGIPPKGKDGDDTKNEISVTMDELLNGANVTGLPI